MPAVIGGISNTRKRLENNCRRGRADAGGQHPNLPGGQEVASSNLVGPTILPLWYPLVDAPLLGAAGTGV